MLSKDILNTFIELTLLTIDVFTTIIIKCIVFPRTCSRKFPRGVSLTNICPSLISTNFFSLNFFPHYPLFVVAFQLLQRVTKSSFSFIRKHCCIFAPPRTSSFFVFLLQQGDDQFFCPI